METVAARCSAPTARPSADSSPAAARSPAPNLRRRPAPAPAPTPTRSAPPHLSLDVVTHASLDSEADAISYAASGALFAARSRCSIGRPASPGVRIAWARAAHDQHYEGTIFMAYRDSGELVSVALIMTTGRPPKPVEARWPSDSSGACSNCPERACILRQLGRRGDAFERDAIGSPQPLTPAARQSDCRYIGYRFRLPTRPATIALGFDAGWTVPRQGCSGS
jgi:hypothetical protein